MHKQFHHMQASIVTDNKGVTFYSYASPIVRECNDGIFIITGRYNYSPTTSRQFSRYLLECTPLAYGWDDVKALRARLADCISGEMFTFNNHTVMYMSYADAMRVL